MRGMRARPGRRQVPEGIGVGGTLGAGATRSIVSGSVYSDGYPRRVFPDAMS